MSANDGKIASRRKIDDSPTPVTWHLAGEGKANFFDLTVVSIMLQYKILVELF